MAFKKKVIEKILDVDASMHGNLSFKDPVNLRINGRFEGNLNTRGSLTIALTANVFADIFGDDIVIAGKVKGKIKARLSLTLLPTAVVEGEIYPAKLNISEGAIFDGRCFMIGDFLNTEELARYLEVDMDSILDWVNQGKMPVIHDGGDLKFERKAIDGWIASGKI